MSMDDYDDDLVESIAPDVTGVLIARHFFEMLDDKLSPMNTTDTAEKCAGAYDISEALLRSLGYNDDELADIFAVLQSRGGFCDCEILYNASETNRLKAKYWKSQAEKFSTRT